MSFKQIQTINTYLWNAGEEPALLTRVEEFIPKVFFVVKNPEIYRLEKNCLNMKETILLHYIW